MLKVTITQNGIKRVFKGNSYQKLLEIFQKVERLQEYVKLNIRVINTYEHNVGHSSIIEYKNQQMIERVI